MSRSLLSFDISDIQRYVFANDRLREIRGASALLDELNREHLISAARQAAKGRVDIIFAGGGAGLLELEESDSPAVADALRRCCKDKTDAGTLHTATVPLNGRPFPESFRMLHARLRVAKGANPEFVSTHIHSFLRTCDACGEYYASEPDLNEPDEKMVCRSCALKIQR